MTLREEVKDIYESRPTRAERNREREEGTAYHRRGKHDSGERKGLLPAKKGYLIVFMLMSLAAIAFLVMLILVKALPPDLTIVLVALMVAMLVAACLLFGSGRKGRRILGIIVAVLFFVLFIPVTYYMGSTFAMFSKISQSGKAATGPAAKSVEVTNEAFNIYITGIDQWASEKGEDLERSDVNMIMTINPKTKKILLTSIPRDTYVKLHTAQQMDKLTHTGVYGVGETLSTVEDWLGLEMNYYVKLNFDAVCDVIDAIGGVDVYSPVEFVPEKREWYTVQKGWNHMNGKEALAFARERHAFEDGDAARVENQQRVIEAIIKKMTSSTTLLTNYGGIMAAAGNNLETNMSASDMTDLIRMQVSDLAEWDIESQKIEGEYDQDYVASLTQSQKFDVYRPYSTSVRNCTENVREVMNPGIGERNNLKKRSGSFFVNMVKRLTGADKEKEEQIEEEMEL